MREGHGEKNRPIVVVWASVSSGRDRTPRDSDRPRTKHLEEGERQGVVGRGSGSGCARRQREGERIHASRQRNILLHCSLRLCVFLPALTGKYRILNSHLSRHMAELCMPSSDRASSRSLCFEKGSIAPLRLVPSPTLRRPCSSPLSAGRWPNWAQCGINKPQLRARPDPRPSQCGAGQPSPIASHARSHPSTAQTPRVPIRRAATARLRLVLPSLACLRVAFCAGCRRPCSQPFRRVTTRTRTVVLSLERQPLRQRLGDSSVVAARVPSLLRFASLLLTRRHPPFGIFFG